MTALLFSACCSWPFAGRGINTISLTMNQWDNCTQSLFYTCRLGNVTGTVTAIGISTNININLDAINMPMLNIGQVVRFITFLFQQRLNQEILVLYFKIISTISL